MIVVGGIAPLDGITDANGIAMISVPATHAGQPADLTVEGIGYKKYVQHINLVADALPGTVQLERQPSTAPALRVASFDSCASVNNLNGPMGAAYNPPDRLLETYVQETDHGCVAKLEYNVVEWSAFWLKLQGADLSAYSKLVFDIRADPQPGIPGQVKVELKRANNTEVSIIYISDITAHWQSSSVDLLDFGPTGYTTPLSAFTQMNELVFVFEASRSGNQGIVYLDNIGFAP